MSANNGMRVIDFRIRPPYRDFLDTIIYKQAARRDSITRSIGFEPSPAAVEQSTRLLLAEMDEGGIGMGVVIGRNSGVLGSVSNDVIKEFCEAHPGRFAAVGSIDPLDRRRAVADIDSLMASGFKAIGMEPGVSATPFHMDDRRLYPIYAYLEDRQIPLILMAGANAGPDLSYTNPEHLDRMLADFPTLPVVVSHGAWPWVTQILHVAFRRSNLFLSPDYCLGFPGTEDYIRAADSWLADRFIYASAFPFAPVGPYLKWFLRLGIGSRNIDGILYGNAARLLRLS